MYVGKGWKDLTTAIDRLRKGDFNKEKNQVVLLCDEAVLMSIIGGIIIMLPTYIKQP